jgi:hypothetical protein
MHKADHRGECDRDDQADTGDRAGGKASLTRRFLGPGAAKKKIPACAGMTGQPLIPLWF